MTDIQPQSSLVQGGRMSGQAGGLERLASHRFDIDAIGSPVFSFPVRSFLVIVYSIAGATAAAMPQIQFGMTNHGPGQVEPGNVYWHRNMESFAFNHALTPGNFNNTGSPSTASIVMGYSGSTASQIIMMSVNNLAGSNHTVQWSQVRTTGAAASPGDITAGWGECFNTNQINKLYLGATTGMLKAKTRVTVFGKSVI